MADSQNIRSVRSITLCISLECDISQVDLVESPLNTEEELVEIFNGLGWTVSSVLLQGPVTKEIKLGP